MKKTLVSTLSVLFVLAGCSEKEETAAVDPMIAMSEKIDMQDGIMTCKVDAVTFGVEHESSARACVKNTSVEICKKYFAEAVCLPE